MGTEKVVAHQAPAERKDRPRTRGGTSMEILWGLLNARCLRQKKAGNRAGQMKVPDTKLVLTGSEVWGGSRKIAKKRRR